MNKRIKVLIILALLPLSIAVPVFLMQTVSLDSQVYAQQSTLQQRVESYKAKLGTTPSQSELNRFKLRCSVAQTSLKGLQTKATTAQENRTKVYSKINEDLQKLITVLKEKSIDTTKLEAQAKELDAKITQFNTDANAYKQAVEDSATNDCTTDPLALRAALQEARNNHTKLITEVADIRAYVNNVIKPSLNQVKTDLKAQQTAAPATTTTGGTDATQQ